MKIKKTKNSIFTMLGHTNVKVFEQYYNQSNLVEMNIQRAKAIPVEQILYRMGLTTQKISSTELWFKSPFSKDERTASFKINTLLNRWYCHSSACGGNSVDLVLKISNCSISEALIYLKGFDTLLLSSFQKQIFETETDQEKSYQIEKIIPVQHLALIQYLKSRGITNYEKVSNLKEIHYSIKDKKYFALGFRNDSGGFEIRSKYAKICLGTKDISHIKNNNEMLRIFEGFFDYLSFVQKQEISEDSDFLILNSVALLQKNISILNEYKAIELYLDNDDAGTKHTNIVLENFENAVDCRAIFKGFKDYNEWFAVCQLEVL